MNKKKFSRFLVCLIAGFSAMTPLIGDDVKVNAAETESSTTKEVLINPLAKYEFNDASNPGKDSMGNYNLVTTNSGANVSVSNGIATFDRTGGLWASSNENDISESLNSFTLAFSIKTGSNSGDWSVPIGFGAENGTMWNIFEFEGSENTLRFSAKDIASGDNQWWGPQIASSINFTSDFHTVILSLDINGTTSLYVDGLLASFNSNQNYFPVNTPAGYNLKSTSLRFAIGCNGSVPNASNKWAGQMKNVRIYNQAMTSQDVTTYLEKGDIYKTVTDTTVDSDSTEIVPVAKYEFKDSTNPGKDSMNNFKLNTKGTVNVSNDMVTFDGTNALIENGKDISSKLSSFTLVFDIKNSGNVSDWAEPIGFGWNNWTASSWCVFTIANGGNMLRFAAGIDGTTTDGQSSPWWSHEIGNISTSNFNRVILSINTSGYIDVYLDGASKYHYATPTNFNVNNANMHFAIGANGTWGNADRNFWKGQMKNVRIYDFAMTASQASAYNTNGKITESDLGETVYIKEVSSVKFTGEATSEPLTETMTTAQMKAKLNTATAVATLSDNTTKELPLTWTNVEEVEGKYYAVGTTTLIGTSMPSKVSKATVRYELTINKDNTKCLEDVNVWFNLAYKYTATTVTNEEVSTTTYSNVEFRLQLGVDSSIASKAAEYNATEFGITVSAGEKTVKYAYTDTVTKEDTTNNIYYEIVSLGDVINNISRASDIFKVQAYMVIDGTTYLSSAVKEYSVKSMIKHYYEDPTYTNRVTGLYTYFNEQGLYA